MRYLLSLTVGVLALAASSIASADEVTRADRHADRREEPHAPVDRLHLPAADRERIVRGNAMKLLKL